MVKATIQKPFRKRRTTKPLKKAKMVPTKALTNAVKSITLKQREVKYFQADLLAGATIYGGGLSTSAFVYNAGAGVANVLSKGALIPLGNSAHTRVGNEIMVKSLNLKGFIAAYPFDNSTNSRKSPFDVYMVIYKRKIDSDGDPANIKEYTNGTTGAINGSIQTTVLAPFNRRGYTIKKVRVFKFKAQPEVIVGGSSAGGIGIVNNDTGNTSTRDYFKTFSIDVPIKKVLKYRGDNTGEPINEWCSVGFYIINGDAHASNASSVSEERASVNLQSQLKYYDD